MKFLKKILDSEYRELCRFEDLAKEIEAMEPEIQKLTDEEFNELQRALNQCEIHGHRGIVETQHQTFSNNWRKS